MGKRRGRQTAERTELIHKAFAPAVAAPACFQNPRGLILTRLVEVNLIMFAVAGLCLTASAIGWFVAQPAFER